MQSLLFSSSLKKTKEVRFAGWHGLHVLRRHVDQSTQHLHVYNGGHRATDETKVLASVLRILPSP